jgi:hypothetical protein
VVGPKLIGSPPRIEYLGPTRSYDGSTDTRPGTTTRGPVSATTSNAAAAATATYGLGAWTDAQNATVFGPVQTYRAVSLAARTLAVPAPWPLADCPATVGNTDTWSATTA